MNLRSKRTYILAAAVFVALLVAYEAYANLTFFLQLRDGREVLRGIDSRVDLAELDGSRSQALETMADFETARRRLDSAAGHLSRDPLLKAGRVLPFLGRQIDGLDGLVRLGRDASEVGGVAAEVLLAFAEFERPEAQTSLQAGLAFLEDQSEAMTSLEGRLEELRRSRDNLPDGLIGPLASAADSFDGATSRLHDLVEGYGKAYATLPGLLGKHGPRSYLLLPQNDSELFPSGGLISSYAIATFDDARLESIELEYFGTLYDRWQAESGREYVPPPEPLRNYLKKGFSWGLGEVGWFPDFPTTAGLARMFVARGGAPATDGVIAMDQQFVQGLLRLLGPVEIAAYGVVITAENLAEKTLELTRNDQYETGRPNKAFLSDLAQAVFNRVFSAPKEKWVPLLTLLADMADQRHLQLNFEDVSLQSLMVEYGFDGGMISTAGDYLMLADTSVNSTKLNLILETAVGVDVVLHADGSATRTVAYDVYNPFDDWRQGRDPLLVRKLMFDGVYGSYTRVYAPRGSELLDVHLNGRVVGAEQAGEELGKQAFGRFFLTLPGETQRLEVSYRTQSLVKLDDDVLVYCLYIQKEAGMRSIPLLLNIRLPAGARLSGAWLDGEPLGSLQGLVSDLETDRVVEVHFRMGEP